MPREGKHARQQNPESNSIVANPEVLSTVAFRQDSQASWDTVVTARRPTPVNRLGRPANSSVTARVFSLKLIKAF